MAGDDFSHTISGLLRKRGNLQNDMAEARERLAVISNDIEAIDRVLDSLGYDGPIKDKTPRTARIVLFYRNELSRFILDTLRDATAPMSSRDLAEAIAKIEGKDKYDRAMICDIVKRAGKACRQLRERGLVKGWKDETKRHVWQIM